MKKKLFILDVSGFIFRAYHALPFMSSPKGESTHALYGFIRSLFKLYKDFSPENIVAVFDGPDNKKSRKEIYEDYKAHRTSVLEDLPEQLDRAKEFLELMGISYLELPEVEADDTMGSLSLWAKKRDFLCYLCTADKDLFQLVQEDIFILNPWKENLIIDAKKVEELFGVTPGQMIDLLAMMGDPSDNIPGLPGIGPKTASKILQEFGSLDAVLEHPEKLTGKKREIFETEKDKALLSRRLATIHTDIVLNIDEKFFAQKKIQFSALSQFYTDLGFFSLVKEMQKMVPQQEEIVDYAIINSDAKLHEIIALLKTKSSVAIDVEGTQLGTLETMPVGIGFSFQEKQGYYIPFNGTIDPTVVKEKLQELFANPSTKFYGHNIKSINHVLANKGIIMDRVDFDTILAAHLLDSSLRSFSLDALSLHFFGKIKTALKDLIGSGKKEISVAEVELEKMGKYCLEDVDYSLRLKELLSKELKNENLEDIFYSLELPLLFVLFQMERRGVFVDTHYLSLISQELAAEINDLSQEIFSLAGESFNLNSPKQLSEILFEKLKIKPLKKTASHYSTSADVLEKLAENYPIAALLLQYRQLDKLKSTYIDALPQAVHSATNRIHPSFLQFGTATGRLSCQDPNLQNIPVRGVLGKKIRAAFRPEDPSWLYLTADYSQIELRLLAHFSEDPHLLQAFRNHEDIHRSTAATMFEIPVEEVTDAQRYQAKAINFGIIYGQGAYGLSQELRIDLGKAHDFINAYFIKYAKVKEYIESVIEESHRTLEAKTLFGRKRKLLDLQSTNSQIQKAAERLAINTPLQGSAADLIKKAMLQIDDLLAKKNCKSQMLLQIHDELVFELPSSELDILMQIVKHSMEEVFPLKVPLIVDLKVGKNWGEC